MMDILFADLAPWFTAPALLGTGFLLIQLLLGEIGTDAGIDADVHADVGAHADGTGHADHPGHEFGILSVQSLSAFFMGYGWIGLGAYRFLGISFTGAAVLAVGAGVGVAWLMITLLRSMLKLQNNTNVSISQARGLVGEVYVTVPPQGQGRGEVVLVINNSRHTYFAIQDGEGANEPIVTHTRVRIVRADTTSNIVIVEPASEHADAHAQIQ